MADALNDLRFPVGQTWANGGTIDTTSDYANSGKNFEGEEYVVEDIPPTGAPTHRTYILRRLRIVRNVSGITLAAKRLVTFQTTAYGRRVDGYATTNGARGFPIDEYLTGGCPNGDLCYVVVEGPAVCKYDLAGGANINQGDYVMALTAATSQAATAGYIAELDLSGATTTLGTNVLNAIGCALSAVTTGNTGNDILVEIRRH